MRLCRRWHCVRQELVQEQALVQALAQAQERAQRAQVRPEQVQPERRQVV
ncbi:MAG: hypothetical protein STSR0003_01610 [Smithella sp.]